MNISAVNNISFTGKKNKTTQAKDKSQYFKYLSQSNVNDALKISKGREVEDGKYKAASGAAFYAGVFGTLGAGLARLNIENKINIEKTRAAIGDKTKEQAAEAVKKLNKKSIPALAGFAVSSGLLLGSIVIDNINERKADKTAHERGFLSNKDYRNKTKPQENIMTDYENITTPQENTKTPQENIKTTQENIMTDYENITTPQENTKTPQENIKIPQENIKTTQENIMTDYENITTPQENIKTTQESYEVNNDISKFHIEN